MPGPAARGARSDAGCKPQASHPVDVSTVTAGYRDAAGRGNRTGTRGATLLHCYRIPAKRSVSSGHMSVDRRTFQNPVPTSGPLAAHQCADVVEPRDNR